MKLKHILVLLAALFALAILLVFVADLAAKVPFGRFDVFTDVMAMLACALILWQCVETWLELRPGKRK